MGLRTQILRCLRHVYLGVVSRMDIRRRLIRFLQAIFVYEAARNYYTSDSTRRVDESASSTSSDDCLSTGTQIGRQPRNLRCPPEATGGNPKTVVHMDDLCCTMPRQEKWLRYYVRLSSCVHWYVLIQSSLLILIYRSNLKFDRGWNCFLPGRLMIHESVVDLIPYFGWLSASLQLAWRYIVSLVHKTYRLDCIIFLISSRQKLEHHINTRLGIQQIESPAMNHWLAKILYMENDQHRTGRTLIVRRPNRTMGAYKELVDFFDKAFVMLLIFSVSLIIILGPYIWNTIVLDRYYVRNYPTCMPDLERLLQNEELSFWSVSIFGWPNYRWFTMPFDLMINNIVWFEDLAFLLIPAILAMLFSQDLIIYWRCLAHRLDDLLIRMTSLPIMGYVDTNAMLAPDGTAKHDGWSPSTSTIYPVKFRGQRNWNQLPENNLLLDELDMEIHLLQQQTLDFFNQLRHYNKYVSLISSFFFITWFTCFMTSSYFAITIENATVIAIIRIVQIYGCAGILVPLYALLRVRSRTKRAYATIASIMCHDYVPGRKEFWSRIMELYTFRPAFGFTFVNAAPITWMGYINFVATSVSFLVIMDTFGSSRVRS